MVKWSTIPDHVNVQNPNFVGSSEILSQKLTVLDILLTMTNANDHGKITSYEVCKMNIHYSIIL